MMLQIAIFLLIILNTALGLIAVDLQFKMSKVNQEQYRELAREIYLRQETDQWNNEKQTTESGINVEVFARTKLQMKPIEGVEGVVEMSNTHKP